MSSEILVKPSELEAHVRDLQTTYDEADTTFRGLKSRLDALSESFRGNAATTFDARFNDWDASALNLLESLESLRLWLDNAQKTLEDVDRQIAGSGA